MSKRAVILTDDEKTLLGYIWGRTASVICHPASGVANLRTSSAGGGGHGWEYSTLERRGHIVARQHEFLPDVVLRPCPFYCDGGERWSHTDDGGHIDRWREGALLFECSIALPRMRQWAEQLPPQVREDLSAARDYATRKAVTLAAINGEHEALLVGRQEMLW
ncbi:hypothetical protein SAMN04489765_0173 [Tsukamurella pulmonis]|uniref:Uncharacterized protein n=1 Tax=Tsukamurella pulmonis TaxID=47312 RepID=A0A1H1ADM1_9ACTN|nr:hypothetical protein [Tsukamurella pulmonis]SDQ37749.1 hypothetical protein SAMN04489765_0173 [Tsukamurella pulmonis]SUQ39363.1 Uncharacterised protein [Tsukamurella pulmonis]